MGEFGIAVTTAKQAAYGYDSLCKEIRGYNKSLQDIAFGMSMEGAYAGIRSVVYGIINENQVRIQELEELREVLFIVIQFYEQAEDRILGTAEGGRESGAQGSQAEEESGLWDYIMDSFKQIVLGDFADEQTLLGTVISVAIGFVPGLGLLCEARDLISNICDLLDDGATAEEWASLGFSVLGAVSSLDDFVKYADKLDDLGDLTKAVVKKANDISSPIMDYVNKYDDFINNTIYKATNKTADVISDAIPYGQTIKKTFSEVMNQELGFYDIFNKTVTNNDVFTELIKEKAENGFLSLLGFLSGTENDAQTNRGDSDIEVGDVLYCLGAFSCVA